MTYMAEALYSLRKRLVESGICACTHPNLKSSIELKRSIICYNPDLRYDDVACINGTCNICKDHTLLHVCGCCLRERIVYEQYGDILPHHDLAKWQDDQFEEACRCMVRGELLVVMDFAMNGSIVLRREAQSVFFMKVGTLFFTNISCA